MAREAYKIQLSDLIPFGGYMRYRKRTVDEFYSLTLERNFEEASRFIKKCHVRGSILGISNSLLEGVSILGGIIGLAKLME